MKIDPRILKILDRAQDGIPPSKQDCAATSMEEHRRANGSVWLRSLKIQLINWINIDTSYRSDQF